MPDRWCENLTKTKIPHRVIFGKRNISHFFSRETNMLGSRFNFYTYVTDEAFIISIFFSWSTRRHKSVPKSSHPPFDWFAKSATLLSASKNAECAEIAALK